MNKLIFAGIAAALALGFALATAAVSYAEQSGFQNISFTEQSAIEQVLSVIGGVNLRQADRTSTQTLKEFSDWRDEAEGPATQPSGGKRLPPVIRERRAF